MTFAVNYLGPFLLTHLLLPLLKKSSGARIVTVASSAHEDVDRIDWEDLPQGRRYDPWGAYALRSLRILPSRIPLPGISRGPG